MVNPRRATRHTAMNLACELGAIVDLSQTGLRIQCAGRPGVEIGSQVKLTVSSPMQRLTVSGQVVWVHKPLLKAGQVGIKFVNTSEAAARALVELAEHGFVDTAKLSEQFSKGSGGGGSSGSANGCDESCGGKTGEERGQASIRASVELEDYYGALGLLPSAMDTEIQEAFRSLARQLHPDVNRSEDATQRFAFISKAYATLKDPAKRLRYDAARRSQAA